MRQAHQTIYKFSVATPSRVDEGLKFVVRGAGQGHAAQIVFDADLAHVRCHRNGSDVACADASEPHERQGSALGKERTLRAEAWLTHASSFFRRMAPRAAKSQPPQSWAKVACVS